MNRAGRFLYRVFFWTYQRGSWQWDLCCLFFLLVIFATPQDFLLEYSRTALAPEQIRTIVKDWIFSFFSS